MAFATLVPARDARYREDVNGDFSTSTPSSSVGRWTRPVLAPDSSVFQRLAIFEWQIVVAHPSALVDGSLHGAKMQEEGREGVPARKGCFAAVTHPAAHLSIPPLPFPTTVTSLRHVALCGDAAARRGTREGRVGRRRRSINIKLSVQHLPTSVATRATTRPARCSRIDFANIHRVEDRDTYFTVGFSPTRFTLFYANIVFRYVNMHRQIEGCCFFFCAWQMHTVCAWVNIRGIKAANLTSRNV